MGRQTAALYGFNRGLVSRLAAARVDLERMALSARQENNWMPRVLGSMMFRPGLGYIDSTKDNAKARHIPFVKSTTETADQAMIELTDGAMRVRIDDEIIARASVSTAIRGGDFSADVTHWSKQTNPATLPPGNGTAVAFSPDGQILAVGSATTPYLRVYGISGSTFTALSFPSSALAGQVNGVAFSSDGQFMALALAASPYIQVYAISGTGGSATFTALSNPGTLPTGTGRGVAFSITAGTVAIAHATSPYVSIYTISGSGASATLTKISDPGTLPTGTGTGAAFSGDGQFLAISHQTTPYLTIYSISGTTYTKISDPGTLPTGNASGIAFSRNVGYLAVAHTSSPYVTAYSISGTTFTKLTNPGTLPTGNAFAAAFSTDNQFLSIAHTTTPYVTNYALSGSGSSTTLTKETDPGTLPAGTGAGVKFSPDNRWLAFAHASSPYVTIYEAYQWLDLDGSGAASTYGGSSSGGLAVGPLTYTATTGSPWTGYTIRTVISAAQIVQSGSAIQLQFSSVSGAFDIDKCYVGHAAGSGDAYDFESVPTQVTFNSGSPGFSLSGTSTILSDSITFALSSSKPLVVAFHCSSSSAGMGDGKPSGYSAYWKPGDDASTVDTRGYISSAATRTAVGVSAVYTAASSVPGSYLSLVGTGYTAAKRAQAVAVPSADMATEHALSVVVARGSVTLRVGTSFGAEDVVSEAVLAEGRHSIAFTPNANLIFVEVSATTLYATLLDSLTIESAGDMVLVTPWTVDDLSLVRVQQSGDVIFCAKYGAQQRRIERRAARSWSIVKYYSADGPYRTENTDDLLTMTPSALSGDITVTASLPFFRSGHVGGLMRITSAGQSVSVALTGAGQWSGPIKVTGTGNDRAITVTRTGTFSATVTLQKSLSAPGNWVDATTYTTASNSTYNDGLDNQTVYYRIGIDTGDYTSGSLTAKLDYQAGQIKGVVRFTGYTSSTVMSAIVLTALGGTEASEVWSEGLWSDYRGWPGAVVIYEGRLSWLGGDKIELSESDTYDSFAEVLEDSGDVGDSSAINRSFGYGPTDRIQWALPLSRLMIGADGAEWSARSNSLDEPLTPSNFNLKTPGTQGSSALQALQIDDQGVFVERSGGRVYGLAFDPDKYDFKSKELSVIVPDLCAAGIVALAVQRKPDTRIHFVLADGTVAVLVFDEGEDVKCWVTTSTPGASGFVEDVAVMPATPEDSVYYTVRRTIGGETVRYYEKWAMESEARGGTLNKQADSFVTFTNSPAAASVPAGTASHLVGESVVCWADGKCLADENGDIATFTVDPDGGISALTNGGSPYQATTGVVGLAYDGDFESAKLAYAAQRGTALTQRHKINALGLILADAHAKGLKWGDDFDHLYDMPALEGGQAVDPDYIWSEYDEPMFPLDGQWGTDKRLCLRASAPRPCTVLAAVLDVSTAEGA